MSTASPARRSDLLLAASTTLLTLVAAAGFGRVFSAGSWLAPVLVCALGGHLVSELTRRTRLPPPAAMGVDLAVVTLLGIWTVLGATTVAGLPLGATWQAVSSVLNQAVSVFPSVLAPTAPIDGFRLLAAWGTGVVAILAHWAALRLRAGLQCLAPAASLFIVCCVLGTRSGRLLAVAALVAAMGVVLLAQRAATGSRATWIGRPGGASVGGTGWAAGLTLAALAAVAASVVTPILPAAEGAGVFGWSNGPDGSGGNRSVPSPIVDLPTRLIHEADVPVFTVRSTTPSYWRLTSLDTFTGVQWQSTDSYHSVHHGLPGTGLVGTGARAVTEQFTIQTLDSTWMPAAVTPVALDGPGASHVSYDPVSGSLLSPHTTSNGLRYTVTSLQYLATLSPHLLATAGPLPTNGSLDRYTALPASMDPRVAALARRITAGATSEYARALALEQYFLAPPFTYSTSPPTDGYGTAALSNFLFSTHVGYCQQFAGAYAVLARAVGLPTRLAVGFTTGNADGSGEYHVFDADAHTWPEVDFPRYGWVPFEPTTGRGAIDGSSFEIPGARAYTGSTAETGPAPSANPTAPTGTVAPPARTPIHALGTTPAPLTHVAATTRAQPGRGVASWVGLLAAGALALAVLVVAASDLARRWRWRHRRAAARSGDVVAGRVARITLEWEETAEVLVAWDLRRGEAETCPVAARRVADALRLVVAEPEHFRRSMVTLADAVTAADFGGGSVSEADVATAAAAGADARRLLADAAPLSIRLGRLLDLRSAWSPDTVDRPDGVDRPEPGGDRRPTRDGLPGPAPDGRPAGGRPVPVGR